MTGGFSRRSQLHGVSFWFNITPNILEAKTELGHFPKKAYCMKNW
jgi:hypothetical protein